MLPCPCSHQPVGKSCPTTGEPQTGLPLMAPSTTWTLPKGQGLNFLYVLVSDSQGGYTEKRIAISTTDPNATARAVVNGIRSQRFHPCCPVRRRWPWSAGGWTSTDLMSS